MLARIAGFSLALLLAACGEAPIVKDGPPPSQEVDVSRIPDAVPMVEPITIAGNKSPYVVDGITYRVLPTAHGYQQDGYASWYGSKFHGRNTSNGEVYNMYGMTAAHKTLPIPCYVQVTNLDNGRQVVLRVNDRGPFHSDRIIDLSWTAAKKLGFHQAGTARVRVVAIDPGGMPVASARAPEQQAPLAPALGSETSILPANTYLQTGAFSSRESAESLQRRIAGHTAYPVEVRQGQGDQRGIFRVMVGPIARNQELLYLRSLLQEKEKLTPFVVTL